MDNSTQNMSEKLVQYLDGDLTGEDAEKLEKQLESDKNLKEQFESLIASREAVRIFGLHQKISGLHGEMMKEIHSPVKKMSSARRIIRYSISVAAGVLLIVVGILGYNFYNLSSNKVYSSNFHSYELITMRDGDSAETTSIEKAYREKDYKNVIELYNADSSLTKKKIFLAGMSNLELGNIQAAINEFQKVLVEDNTGTSNLFKDDADYYLALAYIKNKDYDFALETLKKIKENPGHIYHEKISDRLIRQVRMLKWR